MMKMRQILQYMSTFVFLVLFSISSYASSSIYELKSAWLNTDSKSVQLKEFAGTPIVIGMIYTACAHACPMTIKKMKDVDKALIDAGVKNTRFVLASFDSKNDRPEVLKKYVKGHGLDESKWIFLSAPKDSVARELAVVLDISYKDLGDGDFSHSNRIVALDNAGVPVANIDHLGASVDSLVKGIKESENRKR